MRLRHPVIRGAHHRFERFNVVCAILLAGWVPSLIILWLSYTILSRTLENRVRRDRQTFVELVAQLVGDDLSRTGGIVQYYSTLPETARMIAGGGSSSFAQQWINSVFYSHPRIDGTFLTDRDGHLITSVPANHLLVGKDVGSGFWRGPLKNSDGPYVSPVRPRPGDGQLATEIVGNVRSTDKTVLGYFGVSVLVDRLGRRLSGTAFADETSCQIIDQERKPLFSRTFNANTSAQSIEAPVTAKIVQTRHGYLEQGHNLYAFTPIESTGWTAVIEQPLAIAYKSVHEWRAKMTVLAGWLMGLTGVFAWFGGLFYRRQTAASRRLERELVFNEKILANMPIGIAFVDPITRKFLHANEAFYQMTQRFGGLPSDADILDFSYADVKIAPPDAITKVLSFGTPFQLIEQSFKDEAGMTHFVSVNLLRLQDAHQTTQGVLYLIEDKTRDVALRRELINANASKDQFLALLSHELRNPLSPVISMVAELEEIAPKSPEVREALAVIRRNVELEARLIDDLLDVTRIAKGKLQLAFELVNVHDILRRAYEICREDIAAKQIEARFDLAAADMFVEGDPARLQQVFWNLIKNSVKFTPAGGRITIATKNPAETQIEVSVSDTGIGIEADKIDKIFNAFEQGQRSITRQFGGLGLGLAISKAMVAAHKAKITVASAGAGKGATFTVTLTTVPAPALQSPPRPSRSTPAKRHARREHRILVVDDHADTCAGMKMLLERRGYLITTALSADQALKQAESEDFDLVISDIGLPDRTGYELMRELHQRKGLRGIALSGYGMESDITTAHAAGFSDHLTKPINFDQLEESIRNVLDLEPIA
jgi:signal transduction histidine kinase